eukprot:2826904-Prymnesium_polylepis.1
MVRYICAVERRRRRSLESANLVRSDRRSREHTASRPTRGPTRSLWVSQRRVDRGSGTYGDSNEISSLLPLTGRANP